MIEVWRADVAVMPRAFIDGDRVRIIDVPIGYTFVSFVFDNAPPLSVSIETRPELG
jgi:hypothetical protein